MDSLTITLLVLIFFVPLLLYFITASREASGEEKVVTLTATLKERDTSATHPLLATSAQIHPVFAQNVVVSRMVAAEPTGRWGCSPA